MNSVFVRRCNGINNSIRCSDIFLGFSKGIYLCVEHGNVMNCVYVTAVLSNDKISMNKYNVINYIKSNNFKRYISLINYRRSIKSLFLRNSNYLNIIEDILRYILNNFI